MVQRCLHKWPTRPSGEFHLVGTSFSRLDTASCSALPDTRHGEGHGQLWPSQQHAASTPATMSHLFTTCRNCDSGGAYDHVALRARAPDRARAAHTAGTGRRRHHETLTHHLKKPRYRGARASRRRASRGASGPSRQHSLFARPQGATRPRDQDTKHQQQERR